MISRVFSASCSKKVTLLVALAGVGAFASAQTPSLQVTYGNKGVQTLSFAGVTLEDTGAFGGDAFHIWHMKSIDLNGNSIPGWGENTIGQSWNASSKTETYTFSWGSIATQFIQQGNTLNMVVTEKNNAGSGINFDGAEIYPFALHFPQDPVGFSGYTQQAVTTTGPGISTADFGAGAVTNVLPDESVPMYVGWKNVGSNTYSPMFTTSPPDGLATFLPHQDRPVAPGATFSYTVSLRFTAPGVAVDAADAYASFAAQYPSQLNWTDRRILGTAYLASSPAATGDSSQPGGFPTNPRRYFNDASVDVTTPSGLGQFQKRMLAQAQALVTNTQALNGQGVITWDIEGEQYPQSTSYVCSPDQIATLAPEMESVISDASSAYYGQKLDDAYFKTISSTSLKVGLCLRPQVFTRAANGTAAQIFLTTNASIVANLENKARVANSRWGATIFYVDSTVDSTGGTLDPAIFQQLITDLPGFLFIPEEFTPRYYAYSAPFYSFIFHTTVGTPAEIYKMYPKAFGANLINDVSASTLASYQSQLTQAVGKGDILMGHADYWQANNPTLVAIYKAAGSTGTAPTAVAPAINWATPAGIVYGTGLSAAQLNATSSALGSFTYNPGAGTVLPAGTTTLLTTFTPADPISYRSASSSVTLSIAQATPILSWAGPATIAVGTALGPTQLNAAANVTGAFTYSPAAGTMLPAGNITLRASFVPADTLDYQTATATVPLTVAAIVPKIPAISWAYPASIVYGSALGPAQLNAAASVAGTMTYSPIPGSVLPAGTNILHAAFTPTDSVTYTTASAAVSLNVQQATPALTWGAPASISYGTLLSATQLNATGNVAGSFSYSPGFGSRLNAGVNTLQLSFMPADGNNYRSASATVAISVQQAKPVISWSPPAPITAGTQLSASQLNATTGVPGSFSYSPSNGATLPVGSQTLHVTFYPSDATNYTTANASTTLTVSAQVVATPPTGNFVILSPSPSATASGQIVVTARCMLNLDPAGSYLMVDGVQVGQHRVSSGPFLYPLDTTTLSNGTHTLQLWGHDIGNNTILSPPVVIQVAN